MAVRCSLCVSVVSLLLLSASSLRAVTINRVFVDAGGSFSGGLGVATGAPATVGGGNLVDIFNAAADLWELALLSPHSLTIEFGWQALGGSTLGVHSLIAQGGSPNRETFAVVRFDSDGSSSFFADPTPRDNSEYGTFTAYNADLGGGLMNVGRVWTGATGFAAGSIDLLSVALHEIGHALGLASANASFQAENVDLDVDLQGPRPFAGAAIPTVSGAHLNLVYALMYPSVSPSRRNWISAADILANAEIGEFDSLNLDPNFVPEPATALLTMTGLALLYRRRRSSPVQ